ncbi:hypothetical protein TWF506_002403 [Arthrobotrys conoides]|uniref:Uncharacterized protein n=1 Tax=Arthrobotrys conoides TaxID=74498 RepID=A0AAN8N529_9PEZI
MDDALEWKIANSTTTTSVAARREESNRLLLRKNAIIYYRDIKPPALGEGQDPNIGKMGPSNPNRPQLVFDEEAEATSTASKADGNI